METPEFLPSPNEYTKFCEGDRVQVSPFGVQSKIRHKVTIKTGTVVKVDPKCEELMYVRWDGCITGQRYHRDFLELIESDDMNAPSVDDVSEKHTLSEGP